MTLGTRVHRLAMGCAGILLGSSFALGSIPALAAAAPLRAPSSSALVARLGSATREGPGAVSGVETSPLLPAGSHSEPAVAQGSITEGSYVSVTPARIVDTRAISAGGSGGAYAGQTLAAGATLTVPVVGEGGVPTTGVAAVVLNVTAVDPTAAGFLTVLPGGTTVPTGSAAVSNLNFAAGATVANLVTVGLSATGTVEIYNYTGSTDVVVDVEGYYASTVTTSGLYNPLSPYRALGTLAIGQAIAQDTSQAVTVTGTASGVPSSATAVVVNVTAADATASSFLTVYPAGVSTLPQASNLNFGAQAPLQAIANRVTVGVGAAGQIEVYNHTGTVNVDVDVDGYYTGSGGTGSAFVAITPVRLFDTRTATLVGTGTPIAASGIESFSLTNTTIPSNAAAVAANFTVVPGAAPGYLTVYPEADATPPVASDVNWTANESPAVPNYTIADTAGTGSVAVFNGQGATINLLIDAFGYFVPESLATSQTITFTSTAPTDAQVGAGTYTPTATATSGLPVIITLDGTSIGCALASGVVSFTAPGTCVIDANQPGNATYSAAPQVQQSFTVSGTTPPSCPAPPSESDSANWSGYYATCGPYTSVTGTFTVPSVVGPPTDAIVSEWVGIDGATNTDLIQAGVEEVYEVPGCPGLCIQPWWEILPAASTNITDVTVSAGDKVTVTIVKVSGTTWAITLTDDTNDETFSSSSFTYSGPGASAEWIVEDPSGYTGDGGGLYPFADYSPAVTFSALGFTGTENSLTEVIMVQSTQLSTPSTWTGLTTGFAVAHGDVAPPPP
jgi:hypothetical protein